MRMRMRMRFRCNSHICRRPQNRAGQRMPLLDRASVALVCGPGTPQPAAFDDLGMLPRTIANVLPLVLVLVMVMLVLLGHRNPPLIQVGMVWKIGKGNEIRRGESAELLLRTVVNASNF